MNHPLPPGFRKAFGDEALEELIEGFKEDKLIEQMETLFCRWRHHQVGWDISGPREERDEGFEKALDLLAEAYEWISNSTKP
jgi:hypothetical protein